MYPIYPLLAFAAALSVSAALELVGTIFSSKVAKLLRRGAMFLLVVVSAALFLARVASNHTNYGGEFLFLFLQCYTLPGLSNISAVPCLIFHYFLLKRQAT